MLAKKNPILVVQWLHFYKLWEYRVRPRYIEPYQSSNISIPASSIITAGAGSIQVRVGHPINLNVSGVKSRTPR